MQLGGKVFEILQLVTNPLLKSMYYFFKEYYLLLHHL